MAIYLNNAIYVRHFGSPLNDPPSTRSTTLGGSDSDTQSALSIVELTYDDVDNSGAMITDVFTGSVYGSSIMQAFPHPTLSNATVNHIVEGASGNYTIDVAYTGDPDGGMVLGESCAVNTTTNSVNSTNLQSVARSNPNGTDRDIPSAIGHGIPTSFLNECLFVSAPCFSGGE